MVEVVVVVVGAGSVGATVEDVVVAGAALNDVVADVSALPPEPLQATTMRASPPRARVTWNLMEELYRAALVPFVMPPAALVGR